MFGRFENHSQDRLAATGKQIKIPTRTRLRFTPAKAMKESVLGVTAPTAKKEGAL
jgi:nucleoid DNA-binding protein